jgi:hypothetical protein
MGTGYKPVPPKLSVGKFRVGGGGFFRFPMTSRQAGTAIEKDKFKRDGGTGFQPVQSFQNAGARRLGVVDLNLT